MKISEIFASIQGEGRYVGKPQVFVRFTGCNLRCNWCDTKHAWSGGKDMDLDEAMKEITSYNIASVCITGGEPLFQVMEAQTLVRELKKKGYEIVLETNGTLYDCEIFETVDCVSMDMKPPSSGVKSDESLLKHLKQKDQIKIVVKDRNDLEFAKNIIGKTKVITYLMPEGGKSIKWVVDEVIASKLDVRVLPQLHKLMRIK
ncbi:MAG: 7-carboxy-7-deazaguanine synthase QueE [Candidatus Altiarchaeota archaeon]|nr:7-carboxy-7-deazaguanine synthase QueE [Candidatus Altiarchaeota archaeon]